MDTALDNVVYSKGIVGGGGIKCNTYDSDGVNDTVNFQQNTNTFISLQGDALNRVQFSRPIRVVDAGGSNQADFVESTNNNVIQFRLGEQKNAFALGATDNTLYLNFSKGDVHLGTTLDTPDNPATITINKVSSGLGNAFEVSGDSVFSGTASTNTLNSEGDKDLLIQRNDIEYIRLQGSDSTVRMNYSLVSTNTYVDNHRPTAFGVDTFYYANNSADNAYIEW